MLGRLGVELEIADQALVALDRVFVVAAQILFLDQQQVGVAGLEDAQVAVRDLDVGELGGKRRRLEAVAGVDQLDETLRGDPGLP